MSEEALTFLKNDPSFASKAIHAGREVALTSIQPVSKALYLSSNYILEPPPNHQKGYYYTREGSPNKDTFQKCLASLEDAKYGLAFSSGQASCYIVLHLLKQGAHMITQKSMFYGIQNMFKSQPILKLDVDFIDFSDLSEVKDTLRTDTKLIWFESPTNPMLDVVDLKSVTDLVRKKSPEAIIVCDNTFQTPYFQRPLSFGIDIVMHSCTKYINGHSDSLNGFLATNREDIYEKLKPLSVMIGATPSSFDCFLLSRSLKTLELRMQRHMSNALTVAKFLQEHHGVYKVLHPGLPTHPQFQVTLGQCYGTSGMLSFYIKGDNAETSCNFLRNLKFVLVADSLGGVETTIKMVSKMGLAALTTKQKEEQKITDGLMRASIGVENPQDIIEDFDQALNKALGYN